MDAVVGLLGHGAGLGLSLPVFIKAVCAASSKSEEARIVSAELRSLKTRLKDPSLNARQIKDCIGRLIYCEMLGQDASFAYVHVINLAQRASLSDKMLGYLACALFLHDEHELVLLLINTLQKDLKSTNLVENCLALSAVYQLINNDMAQAVMPLIEACATHAREDVRKRAFVALHAFHTKSASNVPHADRFISKALADPNPSVVLAGANFLADACAREAAPYKTSIPVLVALMQRLISKQFPADFEYQSVPAPWLLIKLLKIAAALAHNDVSASKLMYPVIGDCLTFLQQYGTSMSQAVLFEVISTATSMYPNAPLLDVCAALAGERLGSKRINCKYMALSAFSQLVTIDVKFVASYQLQVIECLEHPDETLKRKTLDLLCKMTNQANVAVVADNLLKHLRVSVDAHFRKELVQRVLQLSERFAPDSVWYFETVCATIMLAAELVDSKVLHKLLKLLQEGAGDENEDTELRNLALLKFLSMLQAPQLPDLLIQAMVWSIGRFDGSIAEAQVAAVAQAVCTLLHRPLQDPLETSLWIVHCLTLLSAKCEDVARLASTVVTNEANKNSLLQQRWSELRVLSQHQAFVATAAAIATAPLQVDKQLSFLDQYVADELASGACKPYATPITLHVDILPADRVALSSATVDSPLQAKKPINFEPYSKPITPAVITPPIDRRSIAPSTPPMAAKSSPVAQLASAAVPRQEPKQEPKRWGRQGDMLKHEQKHAQEHPQQLNQAESSESNIVSSNHDLRSAQLVNDEKITKVEHLSGVSISASTLQLPQVSAEETKRRQLAAALFASPALTSTKSKVSVNVEASPVFGTLVDLSSSDTGSSVLLQMNSASIDTPDTTVRSNSEPANAHVVGLVFAPLPRTSTDFFGQLWQTTSSETKQRIQTTHAWTAREAVDVLCEKLRFGCVQVVKNEAIAGAIVQPSQAVCLLHLKVSPLVVELTVRATASEHRGFVIDQCALALQAE